MRRNSTPSGRSTISVIGRSVTAIGARVAHQRREVDGLARPVDAALGRQEGVERLRRRAPADAAVGQVEGGARQVEEGVVAVGLGDDELRRHAAGAAGEARIEVGIAVVVGRRSPRISLLTATRRSLTPATGLAVDSERTMAWTPSWPESAVRPRSETMNHWVASGAPVVLVAGRRLPR